MNIKGQREVVKVFTGELGVSFDADSALELIDGLKSAEEFMLEVDGQEFRLIHSDDIDEIMQDELISDLYCLGACNARFISDMTELDTDTIQKAQENDSFELLGALLAKDIETVQEAMASADGFGHHFSHYDGSEYEAGNWYIFRTN